MLELSGIWSTPSLSLPPVPLWSEFVEHDRVLFMGQIELNCILMLNWIRWNMADLTFNLRAYDKLVFLK